MNNLIYTNPWIQTLGWTLLHSLWQVPAIYLVLLLAQRLLARQGAHLRYAMGVGALLVVVGVSITTYFLLFESTLTKDTTTGIHEIQLQWSAPIVDSWSPSVTNLLQWTEQQLPTLFQFWFAGFVFFLARMTVGLWYVRQLRTQATPILGYWATRAEELANDLGLAKIITIAEGKVNTPMVIGYLKPVILFPIGLMSGLQADQVETILLHELSHIQRHDFVVNLFQSLTEAIFFFNPFVWMISSTIHQEREHCCDDRVLQKGYEPIVYARALAQVEATRLAIPLTLGLAGRENQLLNRIKRIMEKSVQKDSGRVRLLPIVLVLLGLVCTSWLSITKPASMGERGSEVNPAPVVVDTVKEKGRTKSGTYERRSITRWDENGEPHEEITESYEGDEDIASLMTDFPDFSAMPDFEELADLPQGAAGFFSPPTPDIYFFSDSLPRKRSRQLSQEEWNAFEQEFKTQLKEKFKDFYSKNQEQLERLMTEAKEKSLELNDSDWENLFAERERMREDEWMALVPRMRAFEAPLPDMKRLEADMKRHQEDMLRHEKDMERMRMDMQRQEQEMKQWEGRTREFEKEIRSQLISDGYLDKGEKINNLNFRDDGTMEINGKKIKEKDETKYREIHRKYFKKGDHFIYQE